MRKDCEHKLLDTDCVECWKRRVESLESECDRLKAELESTRRFAGLDANEVIQVKKDRDAWKRKAEKIGEAVREFQKTLHKNWMSPEWYYVKEALAEFGEGK